MKFAIMGAIIFILIRVGFAQDKKNVRIEYKKYESIDLGDLEIKGSIIAPGDISVKERSRTVLKRNLFERYNFDEEVSSDIRGLR